MTRLAQVFANLLEQRGQLHARGRPHRTCGRGAKATAVSVSVTDTGIGIAADKLPSVFEMFAQVEQLAAARRRAVSASAWRWSSA